MNRRSFLKLGSAPAIVRGRGAASGQHRAIVSVLVSPFDSAFVFRRWGEDEQARVCVRDLARAGVDILYLRVRQSQCFFDSKIDFVGVYYDPEDNIVKSGHGWGMPSHSWQDWNDWVHFGAGYFRPNGNEWDAARSYVRLAH